MLNFWSPAAIVLLDFGLAVWDNRSWSLCLAGWHVVCGLMGSQLFSSPFFHSSDMQNIAKHRCPAKFIAAAACLIMPLASSAQSSESVTITTVDGRVLAGQLDSRTDQMHLWVRHESEQIILATPVLWSSIASATVGEEPVDATALREQQSDLASSGPFGFLAISGEPAESTVDEPSANHPIPSEVTAIEVSAALVNLDHDVEPDGFEVAIAALDREGQTVPVRGTLYARLWGERHNSHDGRVMMEDLGRWTKRVQPADFLDGVATLRLRFRTANPAHDLALLHNGLLNVRLGAYGHGNFEASVSVPLRHFEPFRDHVQLHKGSRYLHGELTEGARRFPTRHLAPGRYGWDRF